MAIDKIKRSFIWLRQVLGIIDKTTLPGDVLGEVRVGMDVFGWERVGGVTLHDNSGAAAPATIVNGPITPDDVLRVYFHASVRHTDPGVTHFLWIDKLMPTGGGLIGVTTSNVAAPATVDQSADRWIYVESGARLRGRSGDALVAGALALDLNFVDLDIGEYILR